MESQDLDYVSSIPTEIRALNRAAMNLTLFRP